VIPLLLALALAGTAPKPPVVSHFVPFGPKRRAETAAYAERHYGLHTWRLRRPHVVVEHFTAGTDASSAIRLFGQDVPDAELHELPGTCAHFLVDTDGTIYQLVSTTVRCRHTVGLNWTAIGIEHVGTSDAQILSNRRQLSASLRLTRWLMAQKGITVRNVIGHNESLTSRYHRELYRPWATQTHGDWRKADMDVYRARLRALGAR
jgi:beta-N-acetylhexosaminidase